MMKLLRNIFASALLVTGFVFALTLSPMPVAAQGALDGICENNADSSVCENKDQDAGNFIGIIINTLLFLIGAVSVIMIIIGGITYATSSGDSGSVSKAKNTILYSVIGLAVAFVAYAMVNWVFQLFK